MGYVGVDAVIKIDNRDGSLTDVTGTLNEWSLDRGASPAETTVLGNDAKQRIAGLKEWKCSGKGVYNSTYIPHFYYAVAAQRSMEYSPVGTVTGKPKITGEIIGNSLSLEINFDGESTFSFDADGTGVLTDGTN